MTRIHGLAIAAFSCLFTIALVLAGQTFPSGADAQAGEVVWYRVVNEGRSAGTMPQWERLRQNYDATFPFIDGFEVQIRPQGTTAAAAAIVDRGARTVSAVNCTAPRYPRRGALMYRRDGTDQPGADRPTIVVALACSATRPEAR